MLTRLRNSCIFPCHCLALCPSTGWDTSLYIQSVRIAAAVGWSKIFMRCSQPSDPEVRHVPCAVLIYSRSPQETFLRKRDRKIICPSIVFISGFPWYLYRKSIVTCILNCEQMNNITLNINRFFLGNVWTTSFFHCLIFRTVHSKQFATLSIYWLKFFFMISYKFFLIILGIGENWSNIHGLNVVNVNQGQMPTLRRMNFGKVPNPLTFGKSCCSISVGDFWGLPNQADVDPAPLGLV